MAGEAEKYGLVDQSEEEGFVAAWNVHINAVLIIPSSGWDFDMLWEA